MSNEEIVALIQEGRTDLYERLWWQVERLIRWKAHRLINTLEGSCRTTFDDLYQSGYIAMVDAVTTYKPDSGKFTTWLDYYLKSAFAVAAGYRTKRMRLDPLHTAASLNAPLSDDGDCDQLIDVVTDPVGMIPQQKVEEVIYTQQLHDALEKVLSKLPDRQEQVIRKKYYEGATVEQLAEEYGIDRQRVYQIEGNALRRLRLPGSAKVLLPFLIHDSSGFNPYRSGLGDFRNTGMSAQERYVRKQENTAERDKETLIRSIEELLKV